MDEVKPPMVDGVYDYTDLRGETGPLVYPAGFVWLYGALRSVAGGDGSDVRVAQWIFAGVYVRERERERKRKRERAQEPV